MSQALDKQDRHERAQVLRRAAHRIDRFLDEHCRGRQDEKLERDRDALQEMADEYRNGCQS